MDSQLLYCDSVIEPGESAPEGARFPRNSGEWSFDIPVGTAYLLVSFCSPYLFSWHCLDSSPKVKFSPVANAPPYTLPYKNGTLFCDSSSDCPAGSRCLGGQCSLAPSPTPSMSTPPVPSPSPGPPASTCNLTGSYLQFCNTCHDATGLSYRPQASIRLESTSNGTFSFFCTAETQVGLCPLGAHWLNGTGTLSPSSNAFTLSAKNGSTPFVLTGIVNSTFSCTILTLLSYAESVDRKNRIVHLTKTPSSKDSSFFHYFTRPVYYSLVDVTGHIARAPSLLGSSGGGGGGEGGSGGGEINDGVRRKGAADRGSRALIARSKAGGPAASGGKGYTGSNDSGVRFHGE